MPLLLRRWFLKAAIVALGASRGRAWQVQDGIEFEEAGFDDGGKNVPVELFRPVGMNRRLPAVLSLHGNIPQADEGTREIARGLARRGYVTLVPHYKKGGGTKFTEWLVTVQRAIDFAAQRPEVDPDVIGLVGVSLGGMLVLSAACRDPRVKAVAELFSPWPVGLPEDRPDKLPPVLMLHGDADKSTTAEMATNLDKLLTENKIPHQFHMYKKVGHGFGGKTLEDGFRRIAAFFDENLKKIPAAGSGRSKSKKKR